MDSKGSHSEDETLAYECVSSKKENRPPLNDKWWRSHSDQRGRKLFLKAQKMNELKKK